MVDFLKENKNNPNFIFAQEGYLHYCEKCFDEFVENGGRERGAWPDPFHEHVCLDGFAKSFEEQKKLMRKGKKMMEEILGVSPKIYCPPNHLFNKDSLDLARKLGFEYFMVRNLTGLSAYEDNGLIILPESKIGGGNIQYTFYDHLVDGDWNKFEEVLKNSSGLSSLKISKESFLRIWLNNELVWETKNMRDLKKRI